MITGLNYILLCGAIFATATIGLISFSESRECARVSYESGLLVKYRPLGHCWIKTDKGWRKISPQPKTVPPPEADK